MKKSTKYFLYLLLLLWVAGYVYFIWDGLPGNFQFMGIPGGKGSTSFLDEGGGSFRCYSRVYGVSYYCNAPTFFFSTITTYLWFPLRIIVFTLFFSLLYFYEEHPSVLIVLLIGFIFGIGGLLYWLWKKKSLRVVIRKVLNEFI